jgi:anti-anti-sigma factor
MTKLGSVFSSIITRTDHWIVSLSGAIDAAAHSELLSLAEMLSKRGGDIDFDLSGVRFIDTAGWAGVVAALDAAKAFGISARVVNPSSSVRYLTDLVARSHGPRGAPSRPVPVGPWVSAA